MESIKETELNLQREVVTTVPNTWLVEAVNPSTGEKKMIDIANYASVVAELVYDKNCPSFSSSNIAVGEEVDTGLSGMGTYILTSGSSGYVGLFLVGHTTSSDFVVTKNELGYSNAEGVSNTLRVYRKEKNGNIFVLNNYSSGSARAIKIRRISKN